MMFLETKENGSDSFDEVTSSKKERDTVTMRIAITYVVLFW